MAQIEIDLMLQRLPAFFRGNKNGFKKWSEQGKKLSWIWFLEPARRRSICFDFWKKASRACAGAFLHALKEVILSRSWVRIPQVLKVLGFYMYIAVPLFIK
jgi:hypothetical protein